MPDKPGLGAALITFGEKYPFGFVFDQSWQKQLKNLIGGKWSGIMNQTGFQLPTPEGRRLFRRIAIVPDQVLRHLTRYYVYWRTFYFLAATTYCFVLWHFLDREIWLMVWFNVYSVTAFAVCLLLLRKGYTGRPIGLRLPSWSDMRSRQHSALA